MKIGVQIYSMRSEIHSVMQLEKAFEFIANGGGEAVEMVDFNFETPQCLARISSETGVEIGSTHSNYKRLTEDTERLAEEHLSYGCNIIGLGMMPLSECNCMSRDSILKFCDKLNTAADTVKKYGMTIDYHNHGFEFKKVGKERVLDTIISNTMANVKLCFDMYWAKVGGSSVEEYLMKCPEKINILHFKDYAKKFLMPHYTTVGSGTLDIAGIKQLAVEKGVLYGYVEHDNPKNTAEVIGGGLRALIAK